MATTTYGTPYVQSSDLVSAYPGTSSTLATRVDDVSLVGNGVNAQTASYTLVLTDGGKTITMTNAAATTLTVPTNASVAFPTGVGIVAINLGAGTMTVAGAGGVTVSGASLAVAQYEAVTLRKTATNTWVAVKGGGLPKASVSGTTGSPSTATRSDGKAVYKWSGDGSVTLSTGGTFDLLLVGGGGSGGAYDPIGCGGGGGGGVNAISSGYLPAGTYTVTVGVGGAAITAASTAAGVGKPGTASRLGPYFAPGGGGGSGGNAFMPLPGGSGGGGAASTVTAASTGGRGIPGLGNNGGNGVNGSGGGGGGGAGAAGANATTTTGGNGGNGTTNNFETLSNQTYGGGGGGTTTGSTQGTGGTGGGTAGVSTGNSTAGTDGLGGGSGACRTVGGTAGKGGNGIVVLVIG